MEIDVQHVPTTCRDVGRWIPLQNHGNATCFRANRRNDESVPENSVATRPQDSKWLLLLQQALSIASVIVDGAPARVYGMQDCYPAFGGNANTHVLLVVSTCPFKVPFLLSR
jgi:hypothetical protein